MRVIRNNDKINHLAVVAGGARWAGLPGLAAGSSLRQVTAVGTETRAEAGALIGRPRAADAVCAIRSWWKQKLEAKTILVRQG